MSANDNKPDISALVADIVAAYVANHTVDAAELPALINRIHQSLVTLNGSTKRIGPLKPAAKPAHPIEQSVQDEYLVCLEDGKKMKMLKRYLQRNFNLTPDEYRARWGLGADYPMVAPNYAKKRSHLAKQGRLGIKKGNT